MIEQANLLSSTIVSLNFSDEFKRVINEHGITTLQDLLQLHSSEMLELKNFNYHLINELADFLMKHKISYLLKEY